MRLSRRGAAVASLLLTAAFLATIGPTDRARAISTRRVIGCEGPLSGANAAIGVNSCRAVELAVRRANRKGRLPYDLGVKRFDDQGDPAKAPAAAQEAIDDSRVVAVVGPDFSGTALAVGQPYAEAHMLVVSPSATNPVVTQQGFRTTFQAIASDQVEGAAAGRYLAHLDGVHRVAAVDDLSAYGSLERRDVQHRLHAAGIAHFTAHLDGTASKNSSYQALARRIVKRSADTVYYGGYETGAGPLAKALHQVGFTGRFLSDDEARDSIFIHDAGEAAAASAQFTSPFVSEISYRPAKKFASAYQSSFHTDPSEPAAEAFDAANSVIAALSTLSASPTRAAVASTYRTVDVKGIVNRVSFDHRHRLVHGRIFLYGVEGLDIVQSRRLPG